MKVIGITGGVGAGKTTVINLLKELCNCRVVMADDVAKELMMMDGPLSKDAIRIFGKEAYLENGALNTSHLSQIMFSNTGIKAEWTSLVHPAVKNRIIEMINCEKKKDTTEFFFIEAALLLEDNYDALCDEIWYVHVPAKERIKRLESGRGYTYQKSKSIIDSQLSDEEFINKTDYMIDNSINVENTRAQLEKLLEKY